LFEAARAAFPNAISPADIRVMVNLYTNADRFSDAVNVLEDYFIVGTYEEGFGLWAAHIYDRAGETAKAILAAWLDLDYEAASTGLSDAAVKARLDETEAILKKSPPAWNAAAEDVAWLRAASSVGPLPIATDPTAEYNYIRLYVRLRAQVKAGAPLPDTLVMLDVMEQFFRNCPAFYALLWEAAPPANQDAFLPALERVIALAPPAAPVAIQARQRLKERVNILLQ
jgi:hypothetical protein